MTRTGCSGSRWRKPSSPRRGSFRSGGVTLRTSTPATPEAIPALKSSRCPRKQNHQTARPWAVHRCFVVAFDCGLFGFCDVCGRRRRTQAVASPAPEFPTVSLAPSETTPTAWAVVLRPPGGTRAPLEDLHRRAWLRFADRQSRRLWVRFDVPPKRRWVRFVERCHSRRWVRFVEWIPRHRWVRFVETHGRRWVRFGERRSVRFSAPDTRRWVRFVERIPRHRWVRFDDRAGRRWVRFDEARFRRGPTRARC